MADDPILDATTIAAFAAALDAVFGLNLPVTMPPGNLLAELWASKIVVTKDPGPGVLYAAEGTESIPLPVLPPATVHMDVDLPTTTATRGHRPGQRGDV